ncbi:MAG TPA: EamA family transporter [Streptosporangiaceae bacterium]|nr:EamA family transporter [Streptosporangiaceae bacterium]
MSLISPPRQAPGRPKQDVLGRVPAPVLLGAGILSVQIGAGIAARMFGTVSAAGLTGLRLWVAAVVLIGLGARPAVRAVRGIVTSRAYKDAAVAAGFGLTLAAMNFSIYQAFDRIPLGIAVTIEFLGPLGVAIAASRRRIDVLWVALAALGVGLLGTSGISAASFAGSRPGAVVTGLIFALIAALTWACYILLSASTGRRFSGGAGLTIAMGVGAVLITPVAVVSAGRALLKPAVLGTGVAVGLLSSVIPYRFELESLRRVPPRVFGIWMSLEPAIAALVGVVLLSQSLALKQWLAIACVTVATAGAAMTAPSSPAEYYDG